MKTLKTALRWGGNALILVLALWTFSELYHMVKIYERYTQVEFVIPEDAEVYVNDKQVDGHIALLPKEEKSHIIIKRRGVILKEVTDYLPDRERKFFLFR